MAETVFESHAVAIDDFSGLLAAIPRFSRQCQQSDIMSLEIEGLDDTSKPLRGRCAQVFRRLWEWIFWDVSWPPKNYFNRGFVRVYFWEPAVPG
ncbi:hypothetical protein [Rhizobium lusitanum]|uniref:hypothetical protein n=1 Tax=Rhizobium lusitanum TaxID=293958 RepID=UPI001FEE5B3D|nr:hypothetical protein [Rhizobium lusitanum]